MAFDQTFTIKNMEVLTGEGGREEQNIIFLDHDLVCFAKKLSNGIYVPPFYIDKYKSDRILADLSTYLQEFPYQPQPLDVRPKIKVDFNLLQKFNSSKSNKSYIKIRKTQQRGQ